MRIEFKVSAEAAKAVYNAIAKIAEWGDPTTYQKIKDGYAVIYTGSAIYRVDLNRSTLVFKGRRVVLNRRGAFGIIYRVEGDRWFFRNHLEYDRIDYPITLVSMIG